MFDGAKSFYTQFSLTTVVIHEHGESDKGHIELDVKDQQLSITMDAAILAEKEERFLARAHTAPTMYYQSGEVIPIESLLDGSIVDSSKFQFGRTSGHIKKSVLVTCASSLAHVRVTAPRVTDKNSDHPLLIWSTKRSTCMQFTPTSCCFERKFQSILASDSGSVY